jgi:hypothetical protein
MPFCLRSRSCSGSLPAFVNLNRQVSLETVAHAHPGPLPIASTSTYWVLYKRLVDWQLRLYFFDAQRRYKASIPLQREKRKQQDVGETSWAAHFSQKQLARCPFMSFIRDRTRNSRSSHIDIR